MSSVVIVIVIFLFPALLIKLSKKIPLLHNIGLVAVCYAVGFVFSFLPLGYSKSFSELLASVAVAIGIPLILFSIQLQSIRSISKSMLRGYLLMIAAVVIACTASAFAGTHIGIPHSDKLAAMCSGLYTGGTPNLIAIGNALSSGPGDAETIAAAHTADVLVGGIYFFLALTIVKKIYMKLLKQKTQTKNEEHVDAGDFALEYDFSFLKNGKSSVLRLLLVFLLAVVLLGIGAFLEILINGSLEGSLWIIVTVSIGGVAFSFIKPVRETKGVYQTGQYLTLAFSLGLGMSIDLSVLVSRLMPTIAFMASTQTLSIVIHFLLCKMFQIDGGSAFVTSIAGVYGPPFIAPSANAYGDRDLIAPGIICGVFGLAIGNFLGITLGGLFSLI